MLGKGARESSARPEDDSEHAPERASEEPAPEERPEDTAEEVMVI
jgi:hypothetical protein